MRQKFVSSSENGLVIVDASLDGKYVVNFHSILLLHDFFHIFELPFVNIIDFKLNLQLKWVVRIRVEDAGFIVVNLLVSLIQKVIEFLYSRKGQYSTNITSPN